MDKRSANVTFLELHVRKAHFDLIPPDVLMRMK